MSGEEACAAADVADGAADVADVAADVADGAADVADGAAEEPEAVETTESTKGMLAYADVCRRNLELGTR